VAVVEKGRRKRRGDPHLVGGQKTVSHEPIPQGTKDVSKGRIKKKKSRRKVTPVTGSTGGNNDLDLAAFQIRLEWDEKEEETKKLKSKDPMYRDLGANKTV